MTSATTAPAIHASRPVLAVDASADAITALTVMREHRVRHLPVVRGIRCVGLVTEVDLLRALTVSAAMPPPAAGVLCHPPPAVTQDTPLPMVAAAILAGGLDAALVVSEGILCGIITSSDVLVAVAGSAADSG